MAGVLPLVNIMKSNNHWAQKYRIDSSVVPPAVHATRAMPARAVCMYCRWGYTRVSTVHMQVSSVVPPAVHATRAMPARAVCVYCRWGYTLVSTVYCAHTTKVH